MTEFPLFMCHYLPLVTNIIMNASQPTLVHSINLNGYYIKYSREINESGSYIRVSVPSAPSFSGPMVNNKLPLKIHNKLSHTCRQMYRPEEYTATILRVEQFILNTVDKQDTNIETNIRLI
jgi:hypothetical protein